MVKLVSAGLHFRVQPVNKTTTTLCAVSEHGSFIIELVLWV